MRLADVFVAVRADMSDVNQAFRSLETGMGGVAKSLGAAGRSLTTNVTLPLLAVGGAASKMAVDFDNTMGQLVGLADVPKESIEALREEIGALGAETGKGPQELAEAFYFVASAGFEAEEAMDVLKIAAKASAAGMGEVGDIARVLGGAINSYGKENLTAARAADILTAAVTEGTAEAGEFAAVLPQVVPAAAQLGVSLEEVTGAIAAITTTGSSAAMAAVGLNQVFSNLLKPTAEANDVLGNFGLSAQGLRDQLKNEGLISVLRTLEQTFGDDEEAMGKVFGNTRSLRAAFSLLNLDAAALDGVMSSVVNSQDKLSEAFEATDNDGRNLAKSWSELQFAAIELGRDVLPVVVGVMKEITEAVRGASTWWKSLTPEVRGTIVQFLTFAAVAGPVLLILGKLVGAAKGVVGGVKSMVFAGKALHRGWQNIPTLMGHVDAALAAVTARAPLLGKAFSLLLGPVGLLIAAAFALEAALNFVLGGELDKEKRFMELAHETGNLSSAFREVSQAAKDAGVSGNEFRDKMLDAMEEGHTWAESIDIVSESFEKLPNAVEKSLEGSKNIITSQTEKLLTDLEGVVGEGAVGIFDPLSEEAMAARDAVVQAMADTLKGMGDLFQSTDDVEEYWKEFLERLENPYRDTTRVIDLESRLAADAFQTALASNDSGLIADATTRMETLIDQYELLEPGALAAGKLSNPALQAGMEENLAGLITWIETNVTGGALTALTLDEAKALGIDGIWTYAKGMESREQTAYNVAAAVASRAVNALKIDAGPGGASVVNSWLNGMTRAFWANRRNTIDAIADQAANVFGRSLPRSGPLQHPERGGRSIVEAWMDKGMIGGIRAALPELMSQVGMVRAALGLQPGLASMAVPTGSGFASTGMGGGGSTIIIDARSFTPRGAAEIAEIRDRFVGPASRDYLIRNGDIPRKPRN